MENCVSLKKRLQRKGLKVRQLAEMVNLSERQVYQYLAGNCNPSAETAIKIAKITDIPVEKIIQLRKQ